jgi:hypothetical protein
LSRPPMIAVQPGWPRRRHAQPSPRAIMGGRHKAGHDV